MRKREARVILVVDDEVAVLKMVRMILSNAGYHVLATADPQEARSICERELPPVELVLTDVVMPEVSGPELVRILRAINPGLRVLFMSGYPDSGVQQEMERSLAEPSRIPARLIRKPFRPAELVAHVRSLLEETR